MVALENIIAISIGYMFSVDRYSGTITLLESVNGEHHTIQAAEPQPIYITELMVISDRIMRI